ncbi:MAG: ABC transporter permease [Candidatus Eremiobacteraeota bacterium]|nr:ABC transporter permease [Candidatus Eremiobacteraeota bacterium]MBV8365360.1 ABC transporter permease [Candidatus Eremiobacteraeota bacterium]
MRNWVGFGTIVRREFKRTMMTINQVVWPPIITTLLFLFIFGVGLGSSVRLMNGVPYVQFLLPGLVMLNVIASSYDEAASSLFQQRFQLSIQELLIAPLSDLELLLGYLTGSILRGIVIGALIMAIGFLVVHVAPLNGLILFGFMFATSLLFSSLGMIGALLAKTFDNLAIVTTFFITPLTYVGGVFSSLHALPPLVQRVSLFNPILYMIDGLRFGYIGRSDVSPLIDAAVVVTLATAAFTISLLMVHRGVNLRV